MLTLYNVQSQDGFIACRDGDEDFIPDSFWPKTLRALAQYDLILLGRKSYETIQAYEDDAVASFDALPGKKIVVTRNNDFKPKKGYGVMHSAEEILDSNLYIVVTSGPALNNYLLSNKLVDRITYHEVPVALGEGIKPYRAPSATIEIIKLT